MHGLHHPLCFASHQTLVVTNTLLSLKHDEKLKGTSITSTSKPPFYVGKLNYGGEDLRLPLGGWCKGVDEMDKGYPFKITYKFMNGTDAKCL